MLMKIAVVGRGHVGGGLADLWERAGHEVARIGSEGGDASDADVVLLAVPAKALAEAIESVRGIVGKLTIDATNRVGVPPPDGFASNAEFAKARIGGPTAKSFNINFASIYDQIPAASSRPGNLWCGDDGARDAVEQLIRDAGYDPIYAGGLANAAALEDFTKIVFAVAQAGMGQFFYRIAPPGEF
jgi:predicted dinucleotide-binding enzyme